MKKSTRKLHLGRETVSSLSHEALARAGGGGTLYVIGAPIVVLPPVLQPIDPYALGGGRSARCPTGGFTCGYVCMP